MSWLLDLWHFIWDAPEPQNGYISIQDRPPPQVVVDHDTETPRFF